MPFTWVILILFSATAVFYIIFLSFVYYWYRSDPKAHTFMAPLIVPVIYTFEFFLISFLLLSLLYIIASYLPDFLNLAE